MESSFQFPIIISIKMWREEEQQQEEQEEEIRIKMWRAIALVPKK